MGTLDNQKYPQPSSITDRLDRLAEITADDQDRRELLDYLDQIEQDESDSPFFKEAMRIPELRYEIETYCDNIGLRITAITTAEILRHAHYISGADYLAPESKQPLAELTNKINADVAKLAKQLLGMVKHDITRGRQEIAAGLTTFIELLKQEQGDGE